MNRMVQQFEKSFKVAHERGWNKIYVGLDIHETVMEPTWSKDLSTKFYDNSLETLKLMSDDENVCIILWSSSLDESNEFYKNILAENGVNVNYVMHNPECPSTDYANFDKKMYFNVGLDDKFGFIPNEDWPELYSYFLDKKNKMEV